jgi:hypothetical protein
MNQPNPLVRAFFVGRAVAELINERVESAVTEALSELGRFDAEQREQLRQFVEEALARADRAAGTPPSAATTPAASDPAAATQPTNLREGDLQTNIDDLRAEAAELRSQLNRYRNGES